MVVPVAYVPFLVFVLGEFALAALLLALNFNNRANRAFAFLITLRGTSVLTGLFLTNVLEGPASDLMLRVNPYFLLPIAPAVLYFVAVFPRPRARWLEGRAAIVPFAAAAVALDALYLAEHGLYFTLPSGERGPLSLILPVIGLLFTAAAILFARDYLRAPPGRGKASLLLLSLGFGAVALADALNGLVNPGAFIGRRGEYGEWKPVADMASATVVVLLAGLAIHLLRASRRSPEAASPARRYAASLALVAGSLLPVALLGPADRVAAATFLFGFWRLAQPVLCGYALLRHQLFDIDLRVQWTIKQSTVAAAFIGLFFVVSEGAQAVFSEGAGPFFGIAAAGLLVFAIAPLQRAAERVASAAMPGVGAHGELAGSEKGLLYKEQVAFAWADGAITPRERLRLEHLRERLGLSREEAGRLEVEVARDHASRGPMR